MQLRARGADKSRTLGDGKARRRHCELSEAVPQSTARYARRVKLDRIPLALFSRFVTTSGSSDYTQSAATEHSIGGSLSRAAALLRECMKGNQTTLSAPARRAEPRVPSDSLGWARKDCPKRLCAIVFYYSGCAFVSCRQIGAAAAYPSTRTDTLHAYLIDPGDRAARHVPR